MQVPWEAVATIAIYGFGQTIGFIWWMATVSEKLNNLSDKVNTLAAVGFAKKEDVDHDLGRIQKDIDAAHRRIDDLQLKH